MLDGIVQALNSIAQALSPKAQLFLGQNGSNITINCVGGYTLVENNTDINTFVAPFDGFMIVTTNPFMDKTVSYTGELYVDLRVYENNVLVRSCGLSHYNLFASNVYYNQKTFLTIVPISKGKTYKFRWGATSSSGTPQVIIRPNQINALCLRGGI